MNITSAKYANEVGDAVEVQTSDKGSVMICLPPHSDNIVGGQATYAAWIAAGNTPAAYVAPAVDTIALAEQFIEGFVNTGRLLQCKVWLDLIPHANTPKLISLFQWTATVTGIAITGGTVFPQPPVTFIEVAQECIPQLPTS